MGRIDVISVERICAQIWKAEAGHRLFSCKVLGVPFWSMVRMRTYYCLAETSGLFGRPHPRKERFAQKLGGLATGLVRLPQLFVRGWRMRHAATLVLEHSRSRQAGGAVIDIYSYHFVRDAEAAAPGSTLVLARTETGRIEKRDGLCRAQVDVIERLRAAAGRALRFLVPVRYLPHQAIDDLCAMLDEAQRADGRRQLQDIMRRGVIEYAVSRFLYSLLFGVFRNARELVVVDAYATGAGLIAAAKQRRMRVRELQHGVLGRYHLGYSYPSGCSRQHLPDELLVWSTFWQRELEGVWPAGVNVHGYRYLEDLRAGYADEVREPRSMVVISQGAISKSLADLVWANRDVLSGFRIHYKLHPSEYDTWRENASLVRLSGLANVEVVAGGDLYALFARCELQLGVFSTALHEGAAFGCRTVLAPLPGIEYMKNFGPAISFDEFLAEQRAGGEGDER